MNTLIITDKPWKFKSSNNTIVNCEERYTDANISIIQLRPIARLHGIRANKVIIYEPTMTDYIAWLRYFDWLRSTVVFATAITVTFVYVRENTIVFTADSRSKFYEYIKEESK